LLQATAAARGLTRSAGQDDGFYRGKLAAAQYWILNDVPRVEQLAKLCRDGEDSYARVSADWL